MFNPDFFPTPWSVLDDMGIDCNNKIFLEPQAGKGDIILYLEQNGAKQVLACEINPDLASIVKSKTSARFIKEDFLTVNSEEISHINSIIMNPPFSKGVEHILHAWDVAPDGCEIITLFNYDNIKRSDRKIEVLKQLIKDFGTLSEMSNCFKDSERPTNVNVGLIKLYKPSKGVKDEFDGFFMDEEPDVQENGIMKHDAIREIVMRYVGAVRLFESFTEISKQMNETAKPFGVGSFGFTIERDNVVYGKEEFAKELQKKAWKVVIAKFNLGKYFTSGVRDEINRFVEDQQQYPFTMKNIYAMVQTIYGTAEQKLNDSCIEVIDNFTKYTHENRYMLEGWKTNTGHMLNKKFIVPNIIDTSELKWDSERVHIYYGKGREYLEDLNRVLCNLTGEDFNKIKSIYDFYKNERKMFVDGEHLYNFGFQTADGWHLDRKRKELESEGKTVTIEDFIPRFGEWYEWGFFEVKAFKKGTMHLKFKDLKVWEMLNRKYAKAKGCVLPEKI